MGKFTNTLKAEVSLQLTGLEELETHLSKYVENEIDLEELNVALERFLNAQTSKAEELLITPDGYSPMARLRTNVEAEKKRRRIKL